VAQFDGSPVHAITRIVRRMLPRMPGMAPALEPLWAVSAVFWWASASWQFRVSDQSWQRAGWSLRPPVQRQGGRGWCGLRPCGALTGAGVPELDAHFYAEGVRRGGTLVTARVDDDRALTTWEILQRYKSVDPVVLGPNSAASVTTFTVMTASLSRLPMPGLAGVASGLLASILELRQQF
jgi:hypothetical protein